MNHVDEVGHETLERIAGALSQYNTWMYQQIAPFVGASVLEVGSGIGNLSQFLLSSEKLVLSDVVPTYLEILRSRFGASSTVAVVPWDLGADPPTDLELGTFDTVICLNVLEHIKDDRAALHRIHRLLSPHGRLILLVPAHAWLYNGFDRALNHFRRYSQADLKAVLSECGFNVSATWHFNLLGALGWFVNGTLLRKTLLPSGQMKLFDRLVPVLKLEKLFGPPFGISVIAVAEALPRPR